MKILKFIPFYLILSFLSGCYSTQNPEYYIHRASRSYTRDYKPQTYLPQEDKTNTKKFFTQVTTGKFAHISTDAQKAYSYVYLAKIQLKYNDLEKAYSFFDKSEKYASLFPYRYDLLRDYFYSKKDFEETKKYTKLLVNWIDKRINEVKEGTFNVDNLEFMSVRSYLDGKFESDYMDMYNKKEPKQVRENLYIKYLENKKDYSLKMLEELLKQYPSIGESIKE